MQLWQYSLWTILLLFNGNVFGKKLPNFIPKCKAPSPDQEECIGKAAASIQPYLAKGIPELNINPFEPFYVPKVTLSQSTQGGKYVCELTDIFLSGLTNYNLNSFKIQKFTSDELHTYTNVTFVKVIIKARFNLEGTILKIPIHGSGNLIGNFSDVNGAAEGKHKSTNIKGDTYYKLTSVKTKLIVPKIKNSLKFETLKQNNQAISEATNHFLNENVDTIIDDLIPTVEDTITEIISDILRKFYDEFPLNVLFDM